MKSTVWCVGSFHMDVVVQVERFPVPGETLRGKRWDLRPGGKGRNQAASAASFYRPVRMVGALGMDEFAQPMLSSLSSVGVDTEFVLQLDNEVSGASVSFIAPDGSSESVIISGANLQIPGKLIEDFAASLAPNDVVMLQNEVADETNDHVCLACKKAGALTLLNAAPYRALTQSVQDNVNILVLNEVEASEYSGSIIETQTDASSAVSLIFAVCNANTVVITLGSRGTVFGERSGTRGSIYSHKVNTTDALGAGDAFVGALAGKIAQGVNIEQAVRFANAAAAAIISSPYEQRSKVGTEAVEQLLSRVE